MSCSLFIDCGFRSHELCSEVCDDVDESMSVPDSAWVATKFPCLRARAFAKSSRPFNCFVPASLRPLISDSFFEVGDIIASEGEM